MILETILSSIDNLGQVNFAPMGLHLPDDTLDLAQVKEINLRIFRTSQTLLNLETTLQGVLNFTDDVLAFVETALFSNQLPVISSKMVRPPGMAEAKARMEFIVLSIDYSTNPVSIRGEIKYFQEFGGLMCFCRAQSAVLEALICATRSHLLPKQKIEDSWPIWQDIITKTGGIREKEALEKVKEYLIHNGLQIDNKETKETKEKENIIKEG